MELITDPSLILLDEPTSGLDSFKALTVVKILREQARKGKTVISTIHQPGSDIFSLFDRLILMADGHIVYQGDAQDTTSYFSKIGFNCPNFANPADYFLKRLTINYPKQKFDKDKIAFLRQQYQKRLHPLMRTEADQLKLPSLDLVSISEDAVPLSTQYSQLFYRNRKASIRDPKSIRLKIV